MPSSGKKKKTKSSSSKLRSALSSALKEDNQLLSDVADALRRRAGAKLASYPSILQAADALEPVLADTVERRPSFLGNLAYGTARLIGSLVARDASSNRRLAEIAGSSHVGIVFVDLVGFTEYTADNGDDAAVELVERLEEAVATACRQTGGEVVKHLGDGFLLAFPGSNPAIRGAIALRDSVAEMTANDSSLPMVRVAVHAGRPSIERDDIIGNDVNMTSRLLEHCRPGEVLVSEEARKASAEDGVAFSDRGKVQLRGVSKTIHTYSADTLKAKEAK